MISVRLERQILDINIDMKHLFEDVESLHAIARRYGIDPDVTAQDMQLLEELVKDKMAENIANRISKLYIETNIDWDEDC